MRVYRLVIDEWPTPDGKPWARVYGSGTAAPNHVIPEWLAPRLDEAIPLVGRYSWPKVSLQRVADRLKYDEDRDEVAGVLMPVPQRRNYISASGVSELAKDMRAFGAVVRIVQSKPVEWGDPR